MAQAELPYNSDFDIIYGFQANAREQKLKQKMLERYIQNQQTLNSSLFELASKNVNRVGQNIGNYARFDVLKNGLMLSFDIGVSCDQTSRILRYYLYDDFSSSPFQHVTVNTDSALLVSPDIPTDMFNEIESLARRYFYKDGHLVLAIDYDKYSNLKANTNSTYLCDSVGGIKLSRVPKELMDLRQEIPLENLNPKISQNYYTVAEPMSQRDLIKGNHYLTQLNYIASNFLQR